MYQGSETIPDPTLAVPILGMIGIYVILFVVLAVCYVMKSKGLVNLARNREIPNPWLGWLPVADFYILGKLIGPFRFFGYRITKPYIFLPGGLVLTILFGYIPILGVVTSIVFFLFVCAALYRLYSIYSPANAIWFLLLSVVMLFPVLLYLIRNNSPHEVFNDSDV